MKKHQVVIYTSYLHIIGGIETFVYNFCTLLNWTYDVAVYCPRLPAETAKRVREVAKLYVNPEPIECDTLIMVRMMDVIPKNVKYHKSIRMCHACKSEPSWYIRQDCNIIVHVSEASKESFKSGGEVIYNPIYSDFKKSLLLVSATRVPALDKGKNAERMLQLAKMLNDADIPFMWLNFSDAPLRNAPRGFINVGTYQDIQPYIARADYLVQLSDQEGFGYSVLEALINNTAVICTPFSTTKELGVVDGQNGYIVPFGMGFDVHKLLKVPRPKSFKWDNTKLLKKWSELLDAEPEEMPQVEAHEGLVNVRVVTPYRDVVLDRRLNAGETLTMELSRAQYVAGFGYIKIIGEVGA
jgi:glycosyltransferase involved in cell wall biosynthesis